MRELGLISLLKEDVRIAVKNFSGEIHIARMNWIRLFEPTNSLYVGAFTYIDAYPYDEGCGVQMFQINTKTGAFKQVANLLEEHEMFKGIDIYV